MIQRSALKGFFKHSEGAVSCCEEKCCFSLISSPRRADALQVAPGPASLEWTGGREALGPRQQMLSTDGGRCWIIDRRYVVTVLLE